MKLYKEPTILIIVSILGTIAILVAFYNINHTDNGATVNNVVPLPIVVRKDSHNVTGEVPEKKSDKDESKPDTKLDNPTSPIQPNGPTAEKQKTVIGNLDGILKK